MLRRGEPGESYTPLNRTEHDSMGHPRIVWANRRPPSSSSVSQRVSFWATCEVASKRDLANGVHALAQLPPTRKGTDTATKVTPKPFVVFKLREKSPTMLVVDTDQIHKSA